MWPNIIQDGELDSNAILDDNRIMRVSEGRASMASITIRNLAPAVKEHLRVRAAQRGHSMEAEARAILQSALDLPERQESLTSIMRELFGREHGIQLQLPPRK